MVFSYVAVLDALNPRLFGRILISLPLKRVVARVLSFIRYFDWRSSACNSFLLQRPGKANRFKLDVKVVFLDVQVVFVVD